MKRNEKLFAALGKVKEEYIVEDGLESQDLESALPEGKRGKRKSWLKWGAVAASLTLFVFVGFKLLPRENEPGLEDLTQPAIPKTTSGVGPTGPGLHEDLPLLTIPELTSSAGFEGYLAYDAADLTNGNPWTADTSFASLPVFRNTAQTDRAGVPLTDVKGDDLLDQAEAVAEKMGLNIVESHMEYGSVLADCGDVTIEVEQGGVVTIWFDPPVDLPEPFVFIDSSSQREAEAALSHLIAEYSSLLDMREPALDLFTDYDIYGSLHTSYRVYENGGDPRDRILAYSFDHAVFSPDENGRLWIIRRYMYDLADEMGDYPIIGAEEAERLLYEGHYVTTYPEGLPRDARASKVELIYRSSRADEIFMPYYRFLVELPDSQRQNDLKTFGAFYVPAVEQKYIANMPLWDGHFN